MKRFDDFIHTFSSLAKLENSSTARHIYESIIGTPQNLIKMAIVSELNIPALEVCAREIEACAMAPGNDLPADCFEKRASDGTVHLSKTIKQSFGRMVKDWMDLMGYVPASEGNYLSSSLKLKEFKTATAYRRQEGRDADARVGICLSGELEYRTFLDEIWTH